MKLCVLLTTFQSDAASAHLRPSLVSDKHVPACLFQSVSMHWYGFYVPWVKVNGAYYCDVLLLKQLLPDILSSCWQLLLSSAPRVCKSTELLRHKTPDFTPDMWPPNRPDLGSVDYRLLSHSGMCLPETASNVKHR